ncbi:MAG: rhomboid family intramembrane serine protease [Rhodothermales bacterium]|nr:rhomboid family intramembrane serine protease [Rhodothermales bacterium]
MELIQRFKLWYYTQPPALRAILTINVVLYVVWQLVFRHISGPALFVVDHLALHPAPGDIVYQPWQILTYSFLHISPGLNGFLHILFNMLWLVWVGRDFEFGDGSNRFLAVVLLSAIGGALLSVAASAVLGTSPVIYGASGSVLGILAAVATYYPTRSIGMLFIGNIRLSYLVIGFLVLDLLFIGSSNTAVAAHFGGALTGFLFARGERSGMDLHTWAGVFFRSRKKQRTTPREDMSAVQRLELWLERRSRKKDGHSATIHTLPVHERKEVREPKLQKEQDLDRLLDKINEFGFDSLTEEEKSFLDNESRK